MKSTRVALLRVRMKIGEAEIDVTGRAEDVHPVVTGWFEHQAKPVSRFNWNLEARVASPEDAAALGIPAPSREEPPPVNAVDPVVGGSTP